MSLQRCMAETTSREFVEWIEYLDEKENETTKLQNYLAQIALEVSRSNPRTKNPRRLKLKHFLLKFERKKRVQQKDLTFKERLQRSKSFWFGLVGMKPPKED